MNSFMKRKLMANRDGRNSYGARGGYVRDHRGDYGDDYAMDYRRDYRRRDYGEEYPEREEDYAGRMYQRGYRAGRDHGDDGALYRRGTIQDGAFDYGDDYGEEEGRMTEKDIRKIDKLLRNADGTRGYHFDKTKTRQIAEQIGIDPEQYGEGVFMVALNLMYSDYCKMAKARSQDTGEFYGEMARAFLEDKDYHGEPEEKLWVYYKAILDDE